MCINLLSINKINNKIDFNHQFNLGIKNNIFSKLLNRKSIDILNKAASEMLEQVDYRERKSAFQNGIKNPEFKETLN
jgi:hypothetical protein